MAGNLVTFVRLDIGKRRGAGSPGIGGTLACVPCVGGGLGARLCINAKSASSPDARKQELGRALVHFGNNGPLRRHLAALARDVSGSVPRREKAIVDQLARRRGNMRWS